MGRDECDRWMTRRPTRPRRGCERDRKKSGACASVATEALCGYAIWVCTTMTTGEKQLSFSLSLSLISSVGRTVHVSRAGENLNQNRGGNTSWPLACKRRAYVGFASWTGTVVHIFCLCATPKKKVLRSFTSSALLNS